MERLIVWTAILLAGPADAALAQSDPPAAVRAVIDRVFDGMREADSAKVRSGFADGARFALLSERDSAATVHYQSIDGWLAAIARSGRRWDERIFDVEIKVDANLASAWTPYTFYLDGEIRHCGVNSIELLKTSAGWKITQLSDTQRRAGCAPPPSGASGGQPEPRNL